MFEKILESEQAQHARHVKWAKEHKDEMKALILDGLKKSSGGTVSAYTAGYQYAVMTWQHRWFWDDSTKVIITHSVKQLHDCCFTDYVFIVPAFTDAELFPTEEEKYPWNDFTVESIYLRYINNGQEVVKHWHMGQWKALIDMEIQKHPCGPRRFAEVYQGIVKRMRRHIRKPHAKFKW